MEIANKNVLIVDDDSHVRIAVRTILTDAGFTVFSADSGKECIKTLENGFSGVILLDIMMPEMDGWDTISELLKKGLDKSVVILMLTAKNSPDLKMIGLQEHVLDYLTKPFDNDDLIEKINFFLRYVPKESITR